MRKSRSREQNVRIGREAETGARAVELCRRRAEPHEIARPRVLDGGARGVVPGEFDSDRSTRSDGEHDLAFRPRP
jgi:hypothetical protein